jgi:hypothetical protein
MLVYRGMIRAWDGRPLVVGTRRGLGVRTDDDIFPDEDGIVEPDSGGMSVCLVIAELPPWRRPPAHGGDGPDDVWALETDDLPDGLVCNVDADGSHAMIEPSRRMGMDDYEELLAETRDLWAVCP